MDSNSRQPEWIELDSGQASTSQVNRPCAEQSQAEQSQAEQSQAKQPNPQRLRFRLLISKRLGFGSPPPASASNPAPLVVAPLLPRGLGLALVALIVLGIGLRFINLGGKPYWLDEAFTSFHLSGYSDAQAEQTLAIAQPISNSVLQRFQAPTLDPGAMGTINHIAQTAPELAPPYFLQGRLWAQVWGATPTVLRSLSLVWGLLLVPAFYVMARSLLGHPLAVLFSLAGLAISPYQILYAQEARPYTQWAVVICLSHWLLWRSLRGQRPEEQRHWDQRHWDQRHWNWIGYGLCVAAGLYTHLLHGLVLVAQGLYVGLHTLGLRAGPGSVTGRRSALGGSLGGYVASMILGLGLFSPWVLWALSNFDNYQTMPDGLTQSSVSWLFTLIKGGLRGLTSAWVDFNLTDQSPTFTLIGFVGILILVGSIVVLSLQTLVAQGGDARGYLLVNLVVPVGILLTADLLFGGKRLTITRYWMPTILMFHLIVGAWGTWVWQRRKRLSQGAIALLLGVSLGTSINMVQASQWWHKSEANAYPAIAAQINAGQSASGQSALAAIPKTLVISDEFFVFALSLSHQLHPDVHWLLFPHHQPIDGTQLDAKRLARFERIFLFRPSPKLLEMMQSQSTLEPIGDSAWRVQG